VHERREFTGKVDLIMGKEQSSEERIPRVLGAERGFQGTGVAKTVERVAKPCVRDF